MSVTTEAKVCDALPPKMVLRLTNPVIRFLLRTPLSRSIKSLALMEFRGRRTGRRHRVVVGWHIVDDGPVVVSPAAWRANFGDGHPATVRWRGHTSDLIGTLVADPAVVASAINSLLRGGTSARSLALSVPAGSGLNADDVINTRRAIIRFEPPG